MPDLKPIGQKRVTVAPSTLTLPPCPLPRPGDEIVWYQETVPYRGKLLGHAVGDAPVVYQNHLQSKRLQSFNSVRLSRPEEPIPPNWYRLPPEGTITKPHEHELVKLREFMARRGTGGVEPDALATEIWHRGYEVYLSGPTVRNVLAEEEIRTIEFVTTMPISRLHDVAVDMYGSPRVGFGTADKVWGRLTVNGGQAILVRLFRHHGPGTADAVFGGDFDRDLLNGDFACNSVFYDSVNEVIVDPTGRGLVEAITRNLSTVCEFTGRTAEDLARIGLRCIGLLVNAEYSMAQECCEQIVGLLERIPALQPDHLLVAIETEILAGLETGTRQERWQDIRGVFAKLDLEPLWTEHIAPTEMSLLT